MHADWYFDFVSPFSYLQLMAFHRLPPELEVRYRPVLFAGLLQHWGHRGPAEIPAKRRQSYRSCVWRAARLGVPFKMPPAHPFNPLKALRLALATDCDPAVVRGIFRFLFAEGGDLHSPAAWEAVCADLGIRDPEVLASQPRVKEALRRNTEEAAALGVYGVPTFAAGGELFWGDEGMELLLAYLADPALFTRGEMARVSDMPVGATRR